MDKKTRQPLVSVLMTAYNRQKYIAEAIESVLNSTYENFELIIVDDCSQDETVEIAKRFVAKDTRVRLFINEQNLGDYPNRNKAASYAKGKYLKYVDADDLVYSHGLEVMVNMMEKFPDAGYGLCTIQPDKSNIFPFSLSPYEAYRYQYFGPGLFGRAPLSSIIRTTAFKDVGGFSGKQHVGDFEMWHLLSRIFSVVLMPQGFIWWREHEDQQMSDNRTNPVVPLKYLLLTKELINHSDCPLRTEETTKIMKNINKRIALILLGRIKRFDIKNFLLLAKKIS
jgi:glycosyltransferase involved in cell wall biosynthesis